MSLESDLYNLLSTDASISAVLNARPFVYNGAIPKGEPDSGAIVINVKRTDNLTGSDGPNRFTIKEAQFDSYHTQYTQSVTMSNAVKALMVTLRGSLATTQISGAIPTRDLDFGKEAGQNGYVFRRLLALDVQHTDLQAGDVANTYTPSAIPAPGGNASLFQGVLVSDTEPTDGQVMVFSASTGKWGPATVAGGGGGGSPNFADSEVPTGAVNGVNAAFTWLHSPVSGSLTFFKNGLRMTAGIAYTLAANVATFNAGYIPQTGDALVGAYRY